MGLLDASDSRLALLTRWLSEDLGFAGSRVEPASEDASFRRYFRVSRDGETYIAMDAPPQKEDVAPFVRVARMLAEIGLNVPVILACDAGQGFLLLSDLGTRQYLDELNEGGDADRLYGDAMRSLAQLQIGGAAAARTLPEYDRALLLREMELLCEWFLGRHLQLDVTAAERGMLHRLFDALVHAASSQPKTFVHRDFHSRNLLLTPLSNPGILDFQDAVHGPITYDLVSLLKDCYIAWPVERVRGWAAQFRQLLLSAGIAAGTDEREYLRWFDLMGLQRHIKVLGIFARLYHRDGKRGYLKDLPRVLEYAARVAAAYPETAEFADFLSRRVAAPFQRAQGRLPLPGGAS